MYRAFLILFLSATVHADQVYLSNGDRFSGAIVSMQADSLTLQSPIAGTIKVPWNAVAALRADTPLHLVTKNGEMRAGTIEMDGARVEVRDGDGMILLRRGEIATVLSDSEYHKLQPIVRPLPRWEQITRIWTGTISLGANLARGNADTSTYLVAANLVRTTPANKLTSYFTLVNAGDSRTGYRIATANLRRGGMRFDQNFDGKQFAFGSFDLEYDQFQRLDLRSILGSGVGRHQVKNERTSLDLLGGATFNREQFDTGDPRLSGELLLSGDLAHKLTSFMSTTQRVAVFPNFTRFGQYRINLDSMVDTSLWRWLSLQVAISNRYLSNPLPGREKNDFLLTTGFKILVKQ
jgi:putative salt-induced outer membrane protein YdiY